MTTTLSPKTCTTAVGHQPWYTFPAASAQPGLPCQPQPVLPQPGLPCQPQPGHRTASLTRPSSRLFTDTDISSVAYKTPCNFYREGTILPVFVQCLYLCHACICAMPVFMALPVFALPVDTNIPGTHWGAPGISVKDQSVHLMILVTRPEPTVRPPSRIAKPRPSSMAMGWIS